MRFAFGNRDARSLLTSFPHFRAHAVVRLRELTSANLVLENHTFPHGFKSRGRVLVRTRDTGQHRDHAQRQRAVTGTLGTASRARSCPRPSKHR
jgi:hypothetical protein